MPTLKAGDIVILDNRGSHKSKQARDAIRQAGAYLFFLPPYSPDLNPIEMMFAKLKTWVKKPTKERSKQPGNVSVTYLKPSVPKNVPHISVMQDMVQLKPDSL